MGRTDMGHMEDYLRTQDRDTMKEPVSNFETPFVDISRHVVYNPHFNKDVWIIGETYGIKTTMKTCTEWAKHYSTFGPPACIVKKITDKGLHTFFSGLTDMDTVAVFVYMAGAEMISLKIPIDIYKRGTVEIWPLS